MQTIIHFIKKEFLQFKRDPKMFPIVFIAPIVQLIILGYAATLDINIVYTAIFDQDKSQTSREIVEKLKGSGYFSIEHYVENYEELTELIENGKVSAGIVIPKNFEETINRTETAKIQTIIDGSDGNRAAISSGYITSIVNDYSQEILVEMMDKKGMKLNFSATVTPETRVWFNPELKTRVFMIPGIAGLLLMVITLLLTSLAVVKEKEIGTLEQLIVTPIKPYQMIIGKLIPYTLFGLIAVFLVLGGMVVIFDISIRGSITYLFIATFIYVLSLLGFGLFVSTISKTQQQAMMLVVFVIMLPMVYLSGFAFPIENMPEIIQYVTYIIPLRYYLVIIRGVILKGAGFSEFWLETTLMLIIGISILSFSVLRFKKRLE